MTPDDAYLVLVVTTRVSVDGAVGDGPAPQAGLGRMVLVEGPQRGGLGAGHAGARGAAADVRVESGVHAAALRGACRQAPPDGAGPMG